MVVLRGNVTVWTRIISHQVTLQFRHSWQWSPQQFVISCRLQKKFMQLTKELFSDNLLLNYNWLSDTVFTVSDLLRLFCFISAHDQQLAGLTRFNQPRLYIQKGFATNPMWLKCVYCQYEKKIKFTIYLRLFTHRYVFLLVLIFRVTLCN